MYDHIEDIKLAQEWIHDSVDVEMHLDDIVNIVIAGFERCTPDCEVKGDYCKSRAYAPEDACLCIRSVFPAPCYYKLYQSLREFYLSNLGLKLTACFASKGTIVQEENDGYEQYRRDDFKCCR